MVYNELSLDRLLKLTDIFYGRMDGPADWQLEELEGERRWVVDWVGGIVILLRVNGFRQRCVSDVRGASPAAV